MKRYFAMAVLALNVVVMVASAANLSEVKTVYLMPMANGLDQYLAVRLSSLGTVQVVTDPQRADALLTDSVGASFEEKVEDLFSKDKAAAKSGQSNNDTPEVGRARVGGGSRSRGTVFMVDRKSRELLWSVFELPKGTKPDDLNSTAGHIADKLGKAVSIKK